jgi:hypothetical protein
MPVGGVRGLGLKGAHDHRLDPGILDSARRPRSRLVPKTFKPMLGEAPTPLANCVGINSQGYANPYLLLDGTLDECIQEFLSKPAAGHNLYEIHTSPQPPLVTEVMSAEHIVELARLREFL